MTDDLISVIDIAAQYGKRKQYIFKILKRLRIETQKIRSTASHGQMIAYITNDESHQVIAELELISSIDNESDESTDFPSDSILFEQGVFYLLQLEPDHDPGRFKVGFATSMAERLRALRCSAPFISIIQTWPCKRVWEKTAIDCVSEGCEKLHTEVFRTNSIEVIQNKCNIFFEMMPKLKLLNSQ
jgi:hypothetical protein